MNSDVLRPIPSDPTDFNTAHHPTDNSFPIIAIAVIGILATGFLLVSYYVFVIKCCLNWHRVDILRRFSTSRRRDNPLIPEFPTIENRGLDETSIRTIPIFRYKNSGLNDRTLCECAVCLSEFEEEENLRFIPNCNHMFHIDCIDVWLQNNANCPLCRISISATPVHSISQSRPLSPLFGNPTLYQHDENFTGNDEDYVIIDLPGRHSVSMDQSLLKPEAQRSNNWSSSSQQPVAQSRTTQQRTIVDKNKIKVDHHISSKGDECIDVRSKFDVQPMRRSFSMGSLDDQQLYLMVQEIVKQQRNQANEILISPASNEGCSNSKLRPSFFSSGSGRGSKSSVLPIHSNS